MTDSLTERAIRELEQWHRCIDDEPPIIWEAFGCNADQIEGVTIIEDETGEWWTCVVTDERRGRYDD